MAFPTNPTNEQIYKNYYYDSTNGLWQFKTALDGSSKKNAAPSGYYLKNKYPTKPSGWYWIQSQFMPNPLFMYVDMTEEGGGYDFYPISGGVSVKRIDVSHSGTPLGLDFVYPRSQAHLRALRGFIYSVMNSDAATYFKAVAVYRNAVTNSGNYTTNIMNSFAPTPDWRVKDGGRWWLMDAPYSEPNGDYDHYNFLQVGAIGTDGSIAFNDLIEASVNNVGCGANYIVSTNSKP